MAAATNVMVPAVFRVLNQCASMDIVTVGRACPGNFATPRQSGRPWINADAQVCRSEWRVTCRNQAALRVWCVMLPRCVGVPSSVGKIRLSGLAGQGSFHRFQACTSSGASSKVSA